MIYYVRIDEDSKRLRELYYEKVFDDLIEIEVEDDFDPMADGAKSKVIDGKLVEMTDEEYQALNPLWNKPVLNETQMLQAKVDVLNEKNKALEKCIIELANAVLNQE